MKFDIKKIIKNRKLQLLFSVIIILFIFLLFYKMNKNKIESFDNNNITIYFINLEKSKDRFHKMNNQCNKYSLPCNRIIAVDGKSFHKNDYIKYIKRPKMKDNSIACFLSHIKALQTFIDSYKSYAIILEDDVDINPQLLDYLKKVQFDLEKENEDFDIIFLGGTRVCGKYFTDHLLKPVQKHKNCNAGAFAYMISKRGAQTIIDKFEKDGIYKMYDHQIRDYFPFMKVLYTNPPLVEHDFDIESDRLEAKYSKQYIEQSTKIDII
jgi:GR25 family glycosyltransferase involved in LPS biosynthesis